MTNLLTTKLKDFVKRKHTQKEMLFKRAQYHKELSEQVKNVLELYDTSNALSGDLARIIQKNEDHFILTRSLQHVFEFANFSITYDNRIKVGIKEFPLGINMDKQQWVHKFETGTMPDVVSDRPGYRIVYVYLDTIDDLKECIDNMDRWFNQP